MTKILVLSDSHMNLAAVKQLNCLIENCDKIIHLGDGSCDLITVFGDKIKDKLIAVDGNCDVIKCNASERVIEIEGVRIFLTHGHLYGVKGKLDKLVSRAKENNATVALYGHTHSRLIETYQGILTVNPGTLTRYASVKSFAFLEVNGDKISAFINERFFN